MKLEFTREPRPPRPTWRPADVPSEVYRRIAKAQIARLLEDNRQLRHGRWRSGFVPLTVRVWRAVLRALDEYYEQRSGRS